MRSTAPFDAKVGAALLGFNAEAVVYCQGISDTDARAYAMDHARMLRSRTKDSEFEKRSQFSEFPFEPNRNLIKATLDQMYREYFET